MSQDGFNRQNDPQHQRPVHQAEKPAEQEDKTSSEKKERREKHKVDAEKQVVKVILELKKLSEVALKHRGEYSKEDTDKIFEAIRAETTESRKNFRLEKDNLEFTL